MGGGLLIVGEPNSGKTALSRRIAMAHFDQQRVYHLFAPESGGIEPAFFKKRLADALGVQGNYEEMFRALPRDSSLVLHDLELWWERSPDGHSVIDEILHLIDRFADQCFFIANTSIHSFHFLQNYRSIARAFLDTVYCEPFDTEELQQAILLRHRSTGLKFELRGRLEDNMSAFALARLFTRFFDFTAGNIGFALRAWIGSVEKVTSERLVLKAPRRPDLKVFEQLGDEERVWLQQFMLHKYLTSERLSRLFRAEESAVQVGLTRLKRAGLVTEFRPDILEVNPYLQPVYKTGEAKGKLRDAILNSPWSAFNREPQTKWLAETADHYLFEAIVYAPGVGSGLAIEEDVKAQFSGHLSA